MQFERDARKARRNSQKHRIAFDQALTAFDDPFALIAPDDDYSNTGEMREWLIGESDNGVLVVVFTRREEGRIYRTISARRASWRERRSHEEFKRVTI